MNSSACSAVICPPGGREQKHDIRLFGILWLGNAKNNSTFKLIFISILPLSKHFLNAIGGFSKLNSG